MKSIFLAAIVIPILLSLSIPTLAFSSDDNDRELPDCSDVEYGTTCDNSEKEDSTTDTPYCDELSSEERSQQDCWDRKDYYQGGPNDGLYPCRDGTAKEDWRDCD